jgi:hypothetical protein
MVFVFNIGANRMNTSKEQESKRTKIDEEELQILWNVGLSDTAIAKKLTEKQGISISQTGVTRARQRLGLAPHFEHNANKQRKKEPKQIYEESRLRANQWKKENPERAKESFANWQKENREERTAYMRFWRQGKLNKGVFKRISTWFITLWRRIKNGIYGKK